MSTFIVIIHVVVCIALILIVLLQTGKGADMGAAFGGGGSQTLFGATGASTFLSKATTVAAIVFMLTSLTLAYTTGRKSTKSLLSDVPRATETTPMPADTPPAATTAPEKQAAPAQQAAPTTGTPTAAPAADEAKPEN